MQTYSCPPKPKTPEPLRTEPKRIDVTHPRLFDPQSLCRHAPIEFVVRLGIPVQTKKGQDINSANADPGPSVALQRLSLSPASINEQKRQSGAERTRCSQTAGMTCRAPPPLQPVGTPPPRPIYPLRFTAASVRQGARPNKPPLSRMCPRRSCSCRWDPSRPLIRGREKTHLRAVSRRETHPPFLRAKKQSLFVVSAASPAAGSPAAGRDPAAPLPWLLPDTQRVVRG